MKLGQTSRAMKQLLKNENFEKIINQQLEKYVRWAWLAQDEKKIESDLVPELIEAIQVGDPIAIKLAEISKTKSSIFKYKCLPFSYDGKNTF